MRVSVIINTIDRAASLRTALESLRRQNYPDFEVIVINGPSTDATAEVLEDYRGFIRMRPTRNHRVPPGTISVIRIHSNRTFRVDSRLRLRA